MALKKDEVTLAVNSLLKVIENSNKNKLLDVAQPIFMQMQCIKIPICPTKQLRFILPHRLTDKLSDVLLITADLKGHKIHPEKAVEFYSELLAKHGVKFIQKVIPLRSLTKEYSQHELRKKLVDQYDVILADGKAIKSLPKKLGRFALYKRKMPIPVNLSRKDLKNHLLMSISKTQMTIKGTGRMTTVQVGHTKMEPAKVAANIISVALDLDKTYPGGWKNIRSLDIKSSTSIPLPIFLSLVSPNNVEAPVEQPKQMEFVEGELSTLNFHNKVLVKPDGTVKLIRLKDDTPLPVNVTHQGKSKESESEKNGGVQKRGTRSGKHKRLNKVQKKTLIKKKKLVTK